MKAELPRSVPVIGAIARVTFQEVVREKVLYNILLFAFLLFASAVLASQLTFIRPARVVLDFGISAINISSALIGIMIGAGMLAKEYDRRTVFVALSHPISKMQFVIGKFLGLCGILILNWLLLVASFLTILYFSSSGASSSGVSAINSTVLLALGLVLLQTFVLSACAILFSAFSTTALSIVMTIGIYLIGNNTSQIRVLGSTIGGIQGAVLKGVANLIPNLEFFSLGTKVTYGIPVTAAFAASSVTYGACVTVGLVLLAGLLIQVKEV